MHSLILPLWMTKSLRSDIQKTHKIPEDSRKHSLFLLGFCVLVFPLQINTFFLDQLIGSLPRYLQVVVWEFFHHQYHRAKNFDIATASNGPRALFFSPLSNGIERSPKNSGASRVELPVVVSQMFLGEMMLDEASGGWMVGIRNKNKGVVGKNKNIVHHLEGEHTKVGVNIESMCRKKMIKHL